MRTHHTTNIYATVIMYIAILMVYVLTLRNELYAATVLSCFITALGSMFVISLFDDRKVERIYRLNCVAMWGTDLSSERRWQS